MSVKAITWAFDAIEANRVRNHSAALVLLALAHAHYQDTGRCDPSVARLASKTGLTRRAVQRALRELEAARLIVTTLRKTDTRGVNKTSAYRLKGGELVTRGGRTGYAQ